MQKLLAGLILLNIGISISNHFKLKQLMAGNDDLQAKLDSLQTTVDDVQARLATAQGQLQTALDAALAAKTALEAELANSVNPEQTQAAIDKIDAITADVAGTVA